MTRPDPTTPPVRRADAMAAGHTDGRLRRSHVALFRGVHIDRAAPVTLEVRIEGALLVVTPGSHVSHYTAAALWGGIVPAHPDIHVSSPRNRTRREGITAHRIKEGQEVVRFRGFRVTSPVQTFLDLAHHLTIVDLVVLAGLPEPEVNHRVHDSDGSLLRRYDLSYLPYRLIIEYDGRQHAESEEQWLTDIGRDETLDDEQIRRLVVVSRDIYATPGNTLARITRAMRRAGMRVPRLRDEWRGHFPGRPGDVAVPA